MSTSRGLNIVAFVVLSTATTFAACTRSTGYEGCIPARGSCDGPAIEMNPLDPTKGCLGPAVALTDVCNTSVNRCAPSSGIGPACAFAPDGGIFVTTDWSDNDVLTAKGWRFALDFNSLPGPFPTDEVATRADIDACAKALCAKPCPGVDVRSNATCSSGDAAHE